MNQVIAASSGLSRRAADQAVTDGRVQVNGRPAVVGQPVTPADRIELDGRKLAAAAKTYLVLNKPTGYICSRRAQGPAPTVYALLPERLHSLKPVGRLDKDSSGLLVLTNDGPLAQALTHPSNVKQKRYQIRLDHPFKATDKTNIEAGVELDDGISKLQLQGQGDRWTITMHEGRNRQIRRTFAALGYRVTQLQRIQFGKLALRDLPPGRYRLAGRQELV